MNKTVIITGSSSGIGAAIAECFATEKWNVGINYRTNIDGANRVRERCIALGSPHVTITKADVEKTTEMDFLIDKSLKLFGRIDCFIFNAGFYHPAAFNPEQYRALHVTVPQHGARKLANIMKSGSLIFTTSAISLSDSDVLAKPSSIRREINAFIPKFALKTPHLSVNGVAPGFVATRLLDNCFPINCESIVKKIPLGRISKPSEIAPAYVFFAENTYMTGQILIIDGGYSL